MICSVNFSIFEFQRRTEVFGGSPMKKQKIEVDASSLALDEGSLQLKFAQDEYKKTRYGASEVLLSYADLEALKRKTGPASLTLLGTVKSSKITRAMIVSSDVYVIVADAASKKSQAQLSALVAALLKQNKYGLARRIPSNDGKVNIGILYPVSDELGKALYFLKLPMAEWVKTVPYRPLPDIEEPPLLDLMSQLVDKMSIDGAGRELLVKDPNFQARNTMAENKVRGEDLDKIPPHIFDLFDPYPGLAPEPILDQISKLYPIPEPPPEILEDDPSPTDDKIVVSSQPAKALTDEQRREVENIEKLFQTDGDSLLLEEEMV
ncbi:unnamed protein product [Nesidiocoris tenuis]|uniref:Ku domain-containing protein n=1 Tax=Nesidiocoris tenuis TaxID=355587 RepID=A0A6H5G0Q4_9HEMI|nr:unnamed protein product [Nesidiocoris tenuis]